MKTTKEARDELRERTNDRDDCLYGSTVEDLIDDVEEALALVRTTEIQRDEAHRCITEARIACPLCRGKGYWSTDVYKNQRCHCAAGKVLGELLEAAAEARTNAVVDLLADTTKTWYVTREARDALRAVIQKKTKPA